MKFNDNETKNIVSFLQKYLKINTAHPNPNYDQAIELFQQQSRIDGFKSKVVSLSSRLKVLIITMQGADVSLPTLVLNNHMDVVPGSYDGKYDPFGGCVHSNNIYGRGTQDMKGIGVAHYFALRQIMKERIALRRTIHIVMVPDEELGGFNGAGNFIKTDEFKKLNVGYVLDEGIPSGNSDSLLIKIAERKVMQVKIISVGESGHSANLRLNNAMHNLSLFLFDIAKFQEEQKQKIKDDKDLGLLLSANITSVSYGSKEVLNKVNHKAEAIIDFRIPPNMSIDNAKSFIEGLLKHYDEIEYEILALSNDLHLQEELNKSCLYNCLSDVIRSLKFEPVSFCSQESSDLRFYLENGIIGLGITPFTVNPNLHGVDEYIKIEDLILGQNVFFNLIKIFGT